MPVTSSPNTTDSARWVWPEIAASATPPGRLRAASFIEWRYYAVLSPSFHGIVGLALVNPGDHFRAIAESGLLLIVAGMLDRPTPPPTPSGAIAEPPAGETSALCWMHLFPAASCRFDTPAPGSVTAGDRACCIALTQRGPAAADIEIEAAAGLSLRLAHVGIVGSAVTPRSARDFAGPLGSGPFGAWWTVDCPSPVAVTDGTLTLGRALLASLAERPGAAPGYATPALRQRVADGRNQWAWQRASGYYEHSFGVRPLPLHGWDFLFVPDATAAQSVVLQTYRGSRALRYADVCWRQDGAMRQQRFDADALRLDWAEHVHDPVLGVRRPLLRRIDAEAGGLRLVVRNSVLDRVPLLRPHRLAVRHFFISEEIGVADWHLTDAHGNRLAGATAQPCGGELAHFRPWAPSPRAPGRT